MRIYSCSLAWFMSFWIFYKSFCRLPVRMCEALRTLLWEHLAMLLQCLPHKSSCLVLCLLCILCILSFISFFLFFLLSTPSVLVIYFALLSTLSVVHLYIYMCVYGWGQDCMRRYMYFIYRFLSLNSSLLKFEIRQNMYSNRSLFKLIFNV